MPSNLSAADTVKKLRKAQRAARRAFMQFQNFVRQGAARDGFTHRFIRFVERYPRTVNLDDAESLLSELLGALAAANRVFIFFLIYSFCIHIFVFSA